jgi:hypothetical protein
MTVPFVCRCCSKKDKCPSDLLWKDCERVKRYHFKNSDLAVEKFEFSTEI